MGARAMLFYSHTCRVRQAVNTDFPMPSHTQLNGLVIREREQARAPAAALFSLCVQPKQKAGAERQEGSAFDFNYGGMTLTQYDKMGNSTSSRHAFSLEGSKIKKRRN
jgi:hypothetical protein